MSTPAHKNDNTDFIVRLNSEDCQNSPFIKKKVEHARKTLAKHPLPETPRKEKKK